MKHSFTVKNRQILSNSTRKCRIVEYPGIKKSLHDLRVRAILRNKPLQHNWRRFFPFVGGRKKSVSGYNFLYDDDDKDLILCVTPDKKNLCFKIDFNNELKIIAVDVGYHKLCSVNKMLPESDGTLVMFQVIIQLIFEHPDIKQYNAISFSDMSVKYVKSFENADNSLLRYETDLMDMYFLSTGCTWYSSLVPMFLSRSADERVFNEDLCYIVGNCTHSPEITHPLHAPTEYPMKWGTFINRLPRHTKEYILFIVKGDTEEPASVVLNRVRKQQKYSIIFHKFIDQMLMAMGVRSLKGKSWTIPLRDGLILAPISYRCKNEKAKFTIPSELITFVSNEEFETIKTTHQNNQYISHCNNGLRIIYNPIQNNSLLENINVENYALEDVNALLYSK
jgi:hypothetical protein